MPRPAKKIEINKLSKLPVYKRVSGYKFRFAHYFNEDGNPDDILPPLAPMSITAYELAQLAISMQGGDSGALGNAAIHAATEFLYECTKQYDWKRQKIVDGQCEVADKFIDVGELIVAAKISKKTLMKILSTTMEQESVKQITTPNSRACILKDGSKGIIGSNGLMAQCYLISCFKNK